MITFMLMLLCSISVYSQEKDSIIYIFPDKVETKLYDEMQKYTFNEKMSFEFYLKHIEKDTFQLFLSQYNQVLDNSWPYTNRFILINDKKYPLIFDYDFMFGTEKPNEAGEFGKRDDGFVLRTLRIYEGYSIKFNKTGNYVSESLGIYRKIEETEFYIKDETMYSENFITQFKRDHRIYKTVSLIEDTIIINDNRESFFMFPTDLPLNKTIIYEKAAKEENQVLTVKRVNFSSLEYNYYKTVKGKKVIEIKGMADLEPSFYEGTIFKDENGTDYEMTNYESDSEEDCWVDIYIGIGNSVDKSFIIYNCEPDRKAIRTPELLMRK